MFYTFERRDALIVDGDVYVIDQDIIPLPVDRLDVNLDEADRKDRAEVLAKLTPREKKLLGVTD